MAVPLASRLPWEAPGHGPALNGAAQRARGCGRGRHAGLSRRKAGKARDRQQGGIGRVSVQGRKGEGKGRITVLGEGRGDSPGGWEGKGAS